MSAEKISRHRAMIERKTGWFSSESDGPSKVAGVDTDTMEGVPRDVPEIELARIEPESLAE